MAGVAQKQIAPARHQGCLPFRRKQTAGSAGLYLAPFKAAARSLAVDAIAAPVPGTSELEDRPCRARTRANGGLIVMNKDKPRTARRSRHWLRATFAWPSIRSVCSLNPAAAVAMETTGSIHFDERIFMRIASSEAPSRRAPDTGTCKFDLRDQHERPPKRSASRVPWQLQQLADEVIE